MTARERPSGELRFLDPRTIRTLLWFLVAGTLGWPLTTLGSTALSPESEALRGDFSPVYVQLVELPTNEEALRGTFSPIFQSDTDSTTQVAISLPFDASEILRGQNSPIA
jgi:hypothetical protein